MTGHSSPGASMQPVSPSVRTRLRTVRPDGTPVYRYQETSARPPIDLVSFDHAAIDRLPEDHRHAHDFLVLVYVERGAGSLCIDEVEQPLSAGRVYPVPPGRVLANGVIDAVRGSRCWATYFLPEALLGAGGVPSPLAWGDHPLLAEFAPDRIRPDSGLIVPVADRPRWSGMFAELADELSDPGRSGFREATAAALTRILIALLRLSEASGDQGRRDPLVSRFFDLVERDFREPVSTRDVAAELGYTAGHLTTLVRERTGRTVLEWITERRLIEARQLLADTDLGFDAVARRSGLGDAGYLGRRFRTRYGVTPLTWRRAQRSTADPAED